jgi:serine/threonine protein kinase
MSDLVGQKLGQYQVVDKIAKGGMATVYKARQTSLGRDVAIKVLPAILMHDDSFLERFNREVDVISRLQHPHILPVYDYGEHEGMPYIVMAYIRGGTLADRITSQGPMSLSEVIRVVNQVAGALDYAHSKGIIHRDFKPSNVLMDEQGNTYLADFGLAKLSGATVQITGTAILGTPSYMAPEQAGPGDLTPAADVYALGVAVFQMLTGRVPYDAPTPVGVLMAHASQPIPDVRTVRPTLPDDSQIVIAQAMAKSPGLRYPTPGDLASALSYALDVATRDMRDNKSESLDGLLMTNMLGHVIFLDQPCLKLLKRHQHEARTIIGKPLHEVLGIAPKVAEQLIKDVSKNGQAEIATLELKDARGNTIPASCKATATYDDKRTFVGTDIALKPKVITPDSQIVIDFDTAETRLDSTEETYLEVYFNTQIRGLRELLIQLGGNRLGRNLENIINETAQRNVWPVSMKEGEIQVQLKNTDADIFRALLAKGEAYAVSVTGAKMVQRAMQTADEKLDPRIVDFAKTLRLR